MKCSKVFLLNRVYLRIRKCLTYAIRHVVNVQTDILNLMMPKNAHSTV